MLPEVRAAFIAFTDKYEGDCPFPYTDDVGLVTCCRGNLIDRGLRRKAANDPSGNTGPAPALAIQWVNTDGSLSSTQEIYDAWWTVKNAWPRVQSVACARLTTIRLTPEVSDAMTFSVLDEMWAQALKFFPDAESWPACAQMGLISLMWAMGEFFENEFPHFDAACRAQDWVTAAKECRMTKPPVPVARNAMNVKLFEGAANGLELAAVLAS